MEWARSFPACGVHLRTLRSLVFFLAGGLRKSSWPSQRVKRIDMSWGGQNADLMNISFICLILGGIDLKVMALKKGVNGENQWGEIGLASLRQSYLYHSSSTDLLPVLTLFICSCEALQNIEVVVVMLPRKLVPLQSLLLDCYLIADFNMFQHRPVNRWWFVWFIPTEASNQLELWLVIPSRYIVTPMSPPKSATI